MKNHETHESSNITLMEAMDTLSDIADMEFEPVGEIRSPINKEPSKRLKGAKVSIHWLHENDPESTISLVKETFRTVVHYLKDFYEAPQANDPKMIEGIKSIMLLVGDAAKKIDKYGKLFHQNHFKSVTQLKEYKQLQEIYLKKISRTIDQGILSKWVLALTQKAQWMRRQPAEHLKPTVTKHVFVDLESIKKDYDYELFYLKKEDGSRFFNPRLIRNIKLISDFGNHMQQEMLSDSFSDLNIWQDRFFNEYAKKMITALSPSIHQFYKQALKYKDQELVADLNKAFLALISCSNPAHLLTHGSEKTCIEYFADFQMYLREALGNHEYKKLLTYPPTKEESFNQFLLSLIHSICYIIFTTPIPFEMVSHYIHQVVEEANALHSHEHRNHAEKSNLLWNRLACDYAAMQKVLRYHPSGSLTKVLESIEKGDYQSYDPFFQLNTPFGFYHIFYDERKVSLIRLGSPTNQEFIHKGRIIDEFKGFLRHLIEEKGPQKHLLINLQDRTSWREFARSHLLEDLPKTKDFSNCLVTVSLEADTEFYHQSPPYQEENHSHKFIKNFLSQLKEEKSGYYFPAHLKKEILSEFAPHVMDEILKVFFFNKNVLTKNDRLDFIEIFHLFLELKLLETVNCSSFSMICKDGIDTSIPCAASLFIFLKFLEEEKISQVDLQAIEVLLYSVTFLVRDRILLPEKFQRFINTIKRLETARHEYGLNYSKIILEAFGSYYKTPILTATSRFSK